MGLKIFVSIASFQDALLPMTLQSAYLSAVAPENLVFAVLDQSLENQRDYLRALVPRAELRYVHIHPVESRGVCWARSLVQSLYQNEDFYLQIDSHTVFLKNWDGFLLNKLECLYKRYTNPIISSYPYGFELNEKGEPVLKVPFEEQKPLKLVVHPDTKLTEDNVILRFKAQQLIEASDIEGYHLAGGFIFTFGRFVVEIPYDPYLYFHGEEQSLSVRAYTHGWTIVHPDKIPLYHLYKIPNMDHLMHHWHPQWERERQVKWSVLRDLAHNRLKKMLYDGESVGVYSLGTKRSLAEFARLSGIDYESRQLRKDVSAI